MYFKELTLHNFGVYKGTNTIQLLNSVNNKNITLIGAMNGRGKTTIMEAILFALYGSRALKSISDKSISYSSFLIGHTNKSATDKTCYVSITFVNDEDDQTEIILRRSWKANQRQAQVRDHLFVSKNGNQDLYLADNWNYYIENYLPISIARFCFFDNEKISKIVDDDSFEEIKESIKSLIGISTIDSLISDMGKIIRNKGERVTSNNDSGLYKEQMELTKAINELENNRITIKKEASQLRSKITRLTKKIGEMENEFWEQGGTLANSLNDLKLDQKMMEHELNQIDESIIEFLSDSVSPLLLCQDLMERVYGRYQMDREELSKQYAEPILENISNQICSDISRQNVDEDLKKQIAGIVVQRINQYLPQRTVCVDEMPSAYSQEQLKKMIDKDFDLKRALCGCILKTKGNLLEKLEDITEYLRDSETKTDTFQLYQQIKSHENEKADMQNHLSLLSKELERQETLLLQKNNSYRRVIQQRMQIEKDAENAISVVENANKTIEIMTLFKEKIQTLKSVQLQKNIERCFRYLSAKENIITSIEINPSTLDITLKDYTGGKLQKEQLSAGEKQMFAIAVLWGLSMSSQNRFPVIVDTPMARLDSSHRNNLIEKYFPNASSQVIILSTDEEIYGRYLEKLQPYVNQAYTLVYNEDEKCSSVVSGYFSEGTA